MTAIPLFIPEATSTLRQQVAPGSAIVGTELGAGTWLVYYEGNTVHASNIVTLADCAHHAADRMLTDYPTVAKRIVPGSELRRVGTYHPELGRIEPDGEAGAVALAEWLGLSGSWPPGHAIAGQLVRSK